MKSKLESENIRKVKAEFSKSYPIEVVDFRKQNLRWTSVKMAKIMGISRASLYLKEMGKSPFTAFESYILDELRKEFNRNLKNKNGKSK